MLFGIFHWGQPHLPFEYAGKILRIAISAKRTDIVDGRMRFLLPLKQFFGLRDPQSCQIILGGHPRFLYEYPAYVILIVSRSVKNILHRQQRIVKGQGELMNEAARAGKKLMIGHNQRFMTEHIRAKKMLDDGVIGRVLTFKTCFGHSGPDYWSVDPGTANWFFDKRKSIFGALADLGIHKTDLIQYLLDSEVDEIKSMISTLDKTYSDGTPVNVEDNAICLYKMKNGVIGSMTASWTYYGEEDNSTVIYGTEGIMKIHGEAHCIEIFRKNGEKVTYETAPQNNSGVIDHFINCLVNDVESQISAEKILSSMSVMLRSIAASGGPV